MKRIVSRGLISICCAGLFVIGCAREEEAPPVTMDDLQSQVWDLLNEGETNGALAMLEGALTDETYAHLRSDIHTSLVHFELEFGEVARAQERILALLDAEPDSAESVIGIVAWHLVQQEAYPEAIAWCDTLLEKETGASVAQRLWQVKAQAIPKVGGMPALATHLIDGVARFPEKGPGMLNGILRSTARSHSPEDIAALLDVLEPALAQNEACTDILALSRLGNQLSLKQDDAATALVTSLIETRPAGLRNTALRTYLQAVSERNPQAATGVCTAALDKADPAAPDFATAARYYLSMAETAKDATLLGARIVELTTRGATGERVCRSITKHAYFALEWGDETVRQSILETAETLLARADSERLKTSLTMMILDACFFTSNFEKAQTVIEAGVPGLDEQWHAQILPKVKAHVALKQGKTEAAIGFFREFMDALPEEATQNPMTGQMVSREAILGLNAARIGNLWKSIGDKQKAGTAYAEAREHYAAALAKEEAGSPAYKQVEAELKAVPEA